MPTSEVIHFVTFDVAKIGQGHEDECYRNVIVRLIKRVSVSSSWNKSASGKK